MDVGTLSSSGDVRGNRAAYLARLRRALLPLVVGLLTFAFVWVGRGALNQRTDFDFDYLWTAGHAVWHGSDPYAAVRDAVRQGTLRWPFYYPATAAILVAPLGALQHRLAVALFTALGVALLASSVHGWRRWIILSAPALEAILIGQWSPWLAAAVGLPWLRIVWGAKPTIGLTLFGGWPSRWALVSGAALLLFSLMLLPSWPSEWMTALRGAPHYRAPLQRAGGAILLLAFVRWRRPEARMLGLLALVPHTTGVYEQLPLLLIPQTGATFALLFALSWLAAVLVYTQNTFGANVAGTLDAQWPYFLVLVYIPALLVVLTQRNRDRATSNKTENGRWAQDEHQRRPTVE